MSTLYLKQTNLEIWWDDADEWFYVDWIGYQLLDDFRRGCDQMTRLLKQLSADSLMFDTSHTDGVGAGVFEWVASEWLKEAKAAGLHYLAWVYPPDRFSPAIIASALEKVSPGLTQTFGSTTEAAGWLREQKASRKALVDLHGLGDPVSRINGE